MLFDIVIALYIATKFIFRRSSQQGHRTVVFARGAFRRDISSLANSEDLIIMNGELLRRLLRQCVPDAWLEQVITLNYRQPLRDMFPITVRTFSYFVRKQPTRIIYGGVDYFEIALFADRGFYAEHTTIDAVFHENYAIEYGVNLNMALYKDIREPFLFDNLYTYGPPATRILGRYTLNPTGPRAMVMPRLARMENDTEFGTRLGSLRDPAFAKTVVLLAFPGTEYLAPICCSSTLLYLAELGAAGNARVMVKFKSEKAARPSIRQCGQLKRHLEWKYDGSIEDLVWQAGFTIVFNSISLYEALLGPTIIFIPNYLDAQHDHNLLQETPQTLAGLDSVRFLNSPDEIEATMHQLDTDEIRRLVAMERTARKAVVARKFYLTTLGEHTQSNSKRSIDRTAHS